MAENCLPVRVHLNTNRILTYLHAAPPSNASYDFYAEEYEIIVQAKQEGM